MTAVKPSYLPDFGPGDCLWLVTVRNQWGVHAHTSEAHAMYDAKTLQDDKGKSFGYEPADVRVTKVTIADYQALEYRRETVVQSLVPKDEP
jgi:hypothetical protein